MDELVLNLLSPRQVAQLETMADTAWTQYVLPFDDLADKLAVRKALLDLAIATKKLRLALSIARMKLPPTEASHG